MKVISTELKLALIAGFIGLIGIQVAFNFNKTIGVLVVLISIPLGLYAMIKGQIKFIKKLKSNDKDSE